VFVQKHIIIHAHRIQTSEAIHHGNEQCQTSPGHYRYVAGTCCAFAEAYGRVMNDHNGRKTTWESAAASVACARLCLNEADMVVSIALPAAQIGQIDVIDFLYRNDFLLVLGTSTIFKSSYVWPDKSARIWNEIQVLATMERQ
jgi:hypothetical protein